MPQPSNNIKTNTPTFFIDFSLLFQTVIAYQALKKYKKKSIRSFETLDAQIKFEKLYAQLSFPDECGFYAIKYRTKANSRLNKEILLRNEINENSLCTFFSQMAISPLDIPVIDQDTIPTKYLLGKLISLAEKNLLTAPQAKVLDKVARACLQLGKNAKAALEQAPQKDEPIEMAPLSPIASPIVQAPTLDPNSNGNGNDAMSRKRPATSLTAKKKMCKHIKESLGDEISNIMVQVRLASNELPPSSTPTLPASTVDSSSQDNSSNSNSNNSNSTSAPGMAVLTSFRKRTQNAAAVDLSNLANTSKTSNIGRKRVCAKKNQTKY